MNRLKLSGYLLTALVITVITVFVVIVQNSYSSFMGPIIKVRDSGLGKPLEGVIDINVIDQIELKEEVQ